VQVLHSFRLISSTLSSCCGQAIHQSRVCFTLSSWMHIWAWPITDVVGSTMVKCACRLQTGNSSACVTSLNHTHTEVTMKFVIITVHFLLLSCWDSLNFPDCLKLTCIFYPKSLCERTHFDRLLNHSVEMVAKCVLLMLLGLLYFLSIVTKRVAVRWISDSTNT
jgi:hypothetical protein